LSRSSRGPAFELLGLDAVQPVVVGGELGQLLDAEAGSVGRDHRLGGGVELQAVAADGGAAQGGGVVLASAQAAADAHRQRFAVAEVDVFELAQLLARAVKHLGSDPRLQISCFDGHQGVTSSSISRARAGSLA